MKKDTQSRKWLLTINNPSKNGITGDTIKETMTQLTSCVYYCMSDEIGGKEKTHHTHVYIACSSSVRFSTMKNRFPTAHIDIAKGTSSQNRDYVFKEGKWEKDKKAETNLHDTHFEWGEMPLERQGARNDLSDLYDMIKDGMSDVEILEENAQYMLQMDKLEKVRQSIRHEEFKNKFRQLEVTYIYGDTATGKTRGVMEQYGYENVYRITGYDHGCFDQYSGQDVLLMEEFSSGFKIQNMLNYLDGYPLLLPCRYANKVACYTKVFLISNVDLFEQYPNKQVSQKAVWGAFLRRIHKVIHYRGLNEFKEYSIDEYAENYFEIATKGGRNHVYNR